MQTQVTGEKIIYGFLRSGKTISISVSDDATGQITAVTNTGDPQVWSFETLRGKGAVTWGPTAGDTDFIMYVNQGTMTHDFELNDFIIESERSINNGVIEQPAGGGSGNTNLSATYQASTVTVLSDSGNDAVLNSATTTQAGVMSAADKTKLNGITTAATANATDAQLRDRATHTGTQTASTISDFATAADARITAQKGANNGLATLDSTGKVPAGQLPSYVDDVLEYANFASFPATGETQKIYVAIDTRKAFRWSGSVYQEISPSEVNSVNGRTGAVTVTAADSLNAAQIAGGADSAVGTNDENELINKQGGKEFRAQIYPRNMALNSLLALVNGGGEIASASDAPNIVKLHGTPGAGTQYVFHPAPLNYTYINPLNQRDYFHVGGEGITTDKHNFAIYKSHSNYGGTAPASWQDLSDTQKQRYGLGAYSLGIPLGLSIDETATNLSHESITVMLKTKFSNWTGLDWEQGPSNENLAGQFTLADDSFNQFIFAYAQNDDGALPPELYLANGANIGLSFFAKTPVDQRDPTKLGSGGARVGTTGNAVTDAATFTGGIGSSAYTIGQVVKALKQYGLLAE